MWLIIPALPSPPNSCLSLPKIWIWKPLSWLQELAGKHAGFCLADTTLMEPCLSPNRAFWKSSHLGIIVLYLDKWFGQFLVLTKSHANHPPCNAQAAEGDYNCTYLISVLHTCWPLTFATLIIPFQHLLLWPMLGAILFVAFFLLK